MVRRSFKRGYAMPYARIDNPLTRQQFRCPLCDGEKPLGNVVCWPCNRQQKDRNRGAYSDAAEATIEAFESFLRTRDYFPNHI